VGEEEPEAEDWLGQDIENGIGDDLRVKTNDAATIGNAPDAMRPSARRRVTMAAYIHWVNSPKDQGVASNGSEESLGLAILVGSSSTAVASELVDDGKVSEAGNGIPSPLLALRVTVGGKEASENHDQVGHDSDEDAGTVETGEKGKIEEQEWSGQGPVDVSCPVYLTVDSLVCVWDMLVRLDLDDLVVVDPSAAGHGEI
jgi:hypothetical protein